MANSHAHVQGKCILLDAQKIYWMHGKFPGCTENFTGCTVNLLDAWLSRVRALYAYMPCTAQTVGQ